MRRSLPPFLVALSVFALLVWRLDFVCDDAFISFRYARNLATGAGLRYNPGVEPPVEGYTDFAWVVWMALFERLGVDPLVGSRTTTVLAGALLLWLVVRGAERHFGAAAAWGAGLFLAVQPTFAAWSTGGLGTMVFALTIFLTHGALFDGRGLRAGLFGLVTVLSRADGLFWIGVLLALALATRERQLRRAALVAGAIVVLGVAAHTAGRLAYYGDLVPNTAHAKVGLSALVLERGARYVASYWATVPATALVLAAGVLRALRPGAPRIVRTSAATAAATFAYGALVGGDFMTMGRFFLPALPFLALSFGDLVSACAARRGPVVGAAVAAGAVALSLPAAYDLHPVPRSVREALHFRWSQPYVTEYAMWKGMQERAREWTHLGRALALHTEPDDSVVLSAIGAAGYYSDRFVFDRHGLVSREVARAPEAAPPGRRSPGHDRQVYWSFFADQHPTYANASFHTPDDPPRLSGKREATRVVPLDEADGFPPRSVLVLRLPR